MNTDIKIRLKNYRKVLAEKREYELRLKEKNEDIGVSAITYDSEKTGQTYKISSPTENQAIDIADTSEKLDRLIREKGIEIDRLENAMSVLNDDEKEVLELLYIKNYKINTVIYKLNKSYSRIKQLEVSAIKKMEEIINL